MPQSPPTPATDPPAGHPVPVTVWPASTRPGHDPDGTRPAWPAGIAARLLSTFTRPGQLTAAVDPDPELVLAAACGGHRFTALVTHRHTAEQYTALAEQAAPGPRRAHLRVEHAHPHHLPDLLHRAGHTVELAVLPADTDTALLTAAAGALRPGGHLVLAADAPNPQRWALSAPVLDTLQTAGLGYLQHIVAVRASIHNGQWAPLADRFPVPASGHHQRIHLDLYVFHRPPRDSR